MSHGLCSMPLTCVHVMSVTSGCAGLVSCGVSLLWAAGRNDLAESKEKWQRLRTVDSCGDCGAGAIGRIWWLGCCRF